MKEYFEYSEVIGRLMTVHNLIKFENVIVHVMIENWFKLVEKNVLSD